MEFWHVTAALVSALLHAGWNAAVKSSPQPADAMTAQMIVGAMIVAPLLLWTGLPAPASWGWLAASTMLNTVTVTALLRAYTLAGFGLVYPVVRALSVLLVVPLAAMFSGESLSPWGLAGVALIACSLLLLAGGNRGQGAVARAALGWTVLAGAATAVYVLCDAQGVRHAGSPLAYGFTASITNAVVMGWRQNVLAMPWSRLVTQAWVAIPVGVASMLSYLLILWVWSVAPIAPAAALRDTSAVFALLIAVVWLKEPFTRLRLLAIVLSAAAVPLLRLA